MPLLGDEAAFVKKKVLFMVESSEVEAVLATDGLRWKLLIRK